MMNKSHALIFSTLFISSMAMAENHMLIIGGGGEPQGPTTIFDGNMRDFGNENLSKSNWKYQLSFNGGHATTEQMLAQSYSKPSEPTTAFTQKNYEELLKTYKAKILMGSIKSGDQLMIIVNSHGGQKVGTETTHQIALTGGTATDLNSLEGTPLVSLDTLGELAKLAGDNGINLGIIDLSCHSGATLALKKIAPKSCIITSTGPEHFAYTGPATFSERFLKNLKPGVSLESAFLEARRVESLDSSYPMISTEENDAIVAEVYKSLTPYLYYYDPVADKLTNYFAENSNDKVMCVREAQFKDLISKIEQLKNASNGGQSSKFEELKNLIASYKSTQDSMMARMKKIKENLGSNYLDKKESFSVKVNYKGGGLIEPVKETMTWKQILDFDADKSIARMEELAALNSKSSKAEFQIKAASNIASAEMYRQIKAKKAEIERTFPNIQTYKKEANILAKEIGVNRNLADRIGQLERRFYDDLYREKQSLNFNEPCRSLKF